jgi:hypothetical protein
MVRTFVDLAVSLLRANRTFNSTIAAQPPTRPSAVALVAAPDEERVVHSQVSFL